jgi:hypothetical protein
MGPIIGILIEGVGMADAAVAAIIPLWLMVTFATARTAYYYAVRRRTRALVELADRLEALARDLALPVPQLRSAPTRPALPPG